MKADNGHLCVVCTQGVALVLLLGCCHMQGALPTPCVWWCFFWVCVLCRGLVEARNSRVTPQSLLQGRLVVGVDGGKLFFPRRCFAAGRWRMVLFGLVVCGAYASVGTHVKADKVVWCAASPLHVACIAPVACVPGHLPTAARSCVHSVCVRACVCPVPAACTCRLVVLPGGGYDGRG